MLQESKKVKAVPLKPFLIGGEPLLPPLNYKIVIIGLAEVQPPQPTHTQHHSQ